MRKHRLFTSAIVICLLVCLLTACNITASGNGGNTNNSGGNSDDTTPDCTHPSTEWIIDDEATCTTAGSKHKECSTCGETLSTETIPQKGHDYNQTIIPPTEEQQGYTLHQCSRCEDNYKDNFVDYEYTEAQYKQMFETEILSAIQNYYNENKASSEKVYVLNLELKLINYETGDVYFTCDRNGGRKMFIATHSEITDWATYKALYENMPSDEFEFSIAASVQEDDLAEEIVEFALTLPELQEYIEQNELDLTNYTIINTTEFKSTTEGRRSDIVLLTEDGILSFYLIGTTGYSATQEDYLKKLKDIVITDVNSIIYHLRARVEGMTLTEYYEIPVVTE